TVAEVFEYRHAIDGRMSTLLNRLTDKDAREVTRIVELGINHEQQHQELMLTDIKHLFSCNPLWPAYRQHSVETTAACNNSGGWLAFDGGIVEIGHQGGEFAFDNEGPQHQ